MSWFGSLKISTKFNLILSLLLISLFLAAAFLTYKRQQSLILQVAVDNARIIARQIIETRDYMSSVVRGEPEQNYNLVPQVVATQVAKRITKGSKYYVRQVSLRYRNPDNRPDEYEAGHLQAFASGEVRESYNVIVLKEERSFRYMLPMVAEKSCLECHGDYDKAPRFVRERFPRGHYSYNYKLGEVIGAVSVTIPMVELYRQLGTSIQLDLIQRGIIFLLIISVIGALVRRYIITPIESISTMIARIAVTGNFNDRIPPRKASDEIGQMISSFNAMMEELDRRTRQHLEAEERYRNLIEVAQSAIVTFMEDGRIVVANHKAELLLGMEKKDLLGESIFDFIEDNAAFREGIAGFVRSGRGGGVGETAIHKVRTGSGAVKEMEVALSASMSDHNPLFTAILRDKPGR